MKAGYVVNNINPDILNDVILVDNYQQTNRILNIPLSNSHLDVFKTGDSIGVWKIKKLKK